MVTKPTGKPRGRPSDYREDMPERAFRLCLLGLTNDELGISFGVNPATIDRWIAAYPDFRGSIARGREEADAHVSERLYKRALGYSHEAVKIFLPPGSRKPVFAPYTEHYPPDTQAAFIWLRNRHGKRWQEKQQVAVSGELAVEQTTRHVIDPRMLDDDQRDVLRGIIQSRLEISGDEKK